MLNKYLILKVILLAFVIAAAGCSGGGKPASQTEELKLIKDRAILSDVSSYSTDVLLDALKFNSQLSTNTSIVSKDISKELPISETFTSGLISKVNACTNEDGTLTINGNWEMQFRPLACGVIFRGSFTYNNCDIGENSTLGAIIAGHTKLTGSINMDAIIGFPCNGEMKMWDGSDFGSLVTEPNQLNIWIFSKSKDGLKIDNETKDTLHWLNYDALCYLNEGTCEISFSDAKIGEKICALNIAGGIDCNKDQLVSNFFCQETLDEECLAAGGLNCQVYESCTLGQETDDGRFCFGDPIQQYGCLVDFSPEENKCNPTRWECRPDVVWYRSEGNIALRLIDDPIMEGNTRDSTFMCIDGQIQPFDCKKDSDCRNNAICVGGFCSCYEKPLPPDCDGQCQKEVDLEGPSLCPQDCCGDRICDIGEDDRRCGKDCTCFVDGECGVSENFDFCQDCSPPASECPDLSEEPGIQGLTCEDAFKKDPELGCAILGAQCDEKSGCCVPGNCANEGEDCSDNPCCGDLTCDPMNNLCQIPAFSCPDLMGTDTALSCEDAAAFADFMTLDCPLGDCCTAFGMANGPIPLVCNVACCVFTPECTPDGAEGIVTIEEGIEPTCRELGYGDCGEITSGNCGSQICPINIGGDTWPLLLTCNIADMFTEQSDGAGCGIIDPFFSCDIDTESPTFDCCIPTMP